MITILSYCDTQQKKDQLLNLITGLKSKFPEIAIMTDVALDPYSSDGHDGYVDENGNISSTPPFALK